MVLAVLSCSSTRRAPSESETGASEIESTPPPMAESSWPSRILLARVPRASMPVAQATWTSAAGVAAESAEPRTASRVRLKLRGCLRTAPAVT